MVLVDLKAVNYCRYGGFNAMHASTRNDDPKTASRPMDKDRDGFVLGEGAGGLRNMNMLLHVVLKSTVKWRWRNVSRCTPHNRSTS
jgi:hypothetical protein